MSADPLTDNPSVITAEELFRIRLDAQQEWREEDREWLHPDDDYE